MRTLSRNMNLSYQLPYFFMALVFANVFFNSMSAAFGLSFPYTTFLFCPWDLFADFVKVSLSYPLVENLSINHWPEIFRNFYQLNPYAGIEGLASGELTHFHLPPLTTYLSILGEFLIVHIGPVLSIFFISLVITFFLGLTIYLLPLKRKEKVIIFLILIFSYPFLHTITRGNFFSGLVSLIIIYSLMNTSKKSFLLPLIFLSLGINIRPNTVAFLPFILFFPMYSFGKNISRIILLITLTVLVFFTSLFISNMIYPDYTLLSFLKGYAIYNRIYQFGLSGAAYGSSIYGAINCILTSIGMKTPASLSLISIFLSLSAAFLSVYASILYRLNKISIIVVSFLLCVSYVNLTPVFGDYHLLVFILPIIFYYLKYQNSTEVCASANFTDNVAILCSILLIVPKNYIFVRSISLQVLLNPVIYIAATFLIIYGKNAQKSVQISEEV